MATFLEIHEMRQDPNLKARVEAAIAKVAQYIISTEAANTANHRNRRKWAYDASGMPELFSARMLWSVVGNGTIQAAYISTTPHNHENIPDGDIEWVVGTMVDIYSQG